MTLSTDLVRVEIPETHDRTEVPELLRYIADAIENDDYREGYHPRWRLVPVDQQDAVARANMLANITALDDVELDKEIAFADACGPEAAENAPLWIELLHDEKLRRSA